VYKLETLKTHKIIVDLKKPTVIPLPQFIQQDTNVLEFEVLENGEPADLSNINRIVVNFKRQDRRVFSRLLSAEDNKISYTLGMEEMGTAGIGEVELNFFNDDNTERLSTRRFKVQVSEQIGTREVTDPTAMSVLQKLFVEVSDVKTNTSLAAEFASEQGAYAKEQGDYIEGKKPDIEKFTGEQTNLQAQVDQLVIDGDSSPEAAQARVDGDGNSYTTLKKRLDAKDAHFSEVLAEKVSQSELELKRDKSVPITGADLEISSDASKIKLINLADEVQQALTGNAPALSTIADYSVAKEKIATQGVTLGKLNPEIVNNFSGKSLKAKNAGTSAYINYEVVFDLNDITSSISATSPMRVKYRAYSEDANVLKYGSRIYLNNTPTINSVSGGSSFTPYNEMVGKNKEITNYDNLRENYVEGYRYAHVLFVVNVADKAIFSNYILADFELLIGGFNGKIIAQGYNGATADSTISSTDYLPMQLVTKDEAKSLSEAPVEEFKALRATSFNGYEVYAKSTSSALYVGFLFDLESIQASLQNGNPFRVKYSAYTEDTNILRFGSKIFLNNDSGIFNNSGGLTFATPYMVNNEVGKLINYDQVRDAYTTGYRYAHVYLYIELTDLTKFNTMFFSNFKFYVNDLEATFVSQGLYTVTAGSSITEAPNLDVQLATFKDIENKINEKMQVVSKLSGKTWNVLGDSITEGSSVYTNKVYHKYIQETKGLTTINNYGIGGSTIAKYDSTDTKKSMALRYTSMVDADYITVLGGVNDCAYAIPVGTMADRTVDTFYGALHVLFLGLIEKYPTKKIGAITPLQYRGKRAQMLPYVNAFKEVASFYSLPILDMFNSGQLYPDSDLIRDQLMPDGLHPNTAGHTIMGEKIMSFLENL
jgi:lysophospholipase L1-like esterase